MKNPKFEVCPECEGSGRVLGSAFRGQALEQDLSDDPEFMEGYLSGFYDVQCEECHGLRVVDVSIVKNPCDSCGEALNSSRYEEFGGSGVWWTDYACKNATCEDFDQYFG